MNNFSLERSLAYQYLTRWLPQYKEQYDTDSELADLRLSRALVVEKKGDARFISPKELIAANILFSIVTIETVLLTGEAMDAYEDGTVLDALKKELQQQVESLSQFTSGGEHNTTVQAFEVVLHPISQVRERRLQHIRKQIDVLGYDAMSIPNGGKSAIKNICLQDPALFTEETFIHAWKLGAKANMFRMKNRDKFASGSGQKNAHLPTLTAH